MPEGPSKTRGCLKYGCLGCVVIVGVPVVVLSILVLIGLAVGVPDPVREAAELTHDLPVIGPAELPQEGVIALDPGEVPDTGGRVELNINMASFTVVRGEPGEPLRLEANYDSASFELAEELIETGDDGWTYKVDFDNRLGFFRTLFKKNPGRNELRLVVPPGVPISFVGDVSVGESVLDLGGLWVPQVVLAYGPGSHRVHFDEPMLHPADQVMLTGSVGDIRLTGVGNASPKTTMVTHSVGEARIDLRGAWSRDGEVTLIQSVGELRVTVPDDVRIEMTDVNISVGESNLRGLNELRARQAEEPLPEDAPTLKLNITKSVGELRVDAAN